MLLIENVNREDFIAKFDNILSRGLCNGVGNPQGQMCIEAAICAALGLPHGDDPQCVASAVRSYKIRINDKRWSSTEARATALRDIGIAQLGSKGVVDNIAFAKRLGELHIQILIPALFRKRFPNNPECLAAAQACEDAPTVDNARKAQSVGAALGDDVYTAAASAAYAAYAAYAADINVNANDSADAITDVAAAGRSDKYLILSVNLALQVLREMKSPGVEWLEAA